MICRHIVLYHKQRILARENPFCKLSTGDFGFWGGQRFWAGPASQLCPVAVAVIAPKPDLRPPELPECFYPSGIATNRQPCVESKRHVEKALSNKRYNPRRYNPVPGAEHPEHQPDLRPRPGLGSPRPFLATARTSNSTSTRTALCRASTGRTAMFAGARTCGFMR
jgi:hypothetical protein